MLDGAGDDPHFCEFFSIYAQLFLSSVTDVQWSASTPAQGYLVNPGSPASPSIDQDVETLDKA